MANAQKDKGKRFEREVAKFLSEVFSANFLRVQNSGAFIGKQNSARLAHLTHNQAISQRGDVIPPDAFNLVIECKNHKAFSTGFAGILQGENKVLNAWLKEVLYDSQDGTIPYMLVFKITGQKADFYFALPKKHFARVKCKNYASYISDLDKEYYIIASKEFIANKDAIASACQQGVTKNV